MKLRTKPVKGICIFALIVLVVCLSLLIFFAVDFNNENTVISIVSFVFCGIFILISLFTLINQLFCYVEFKDSKLVKHTLWFSKTLKIERITKITLEEGIYKIFDDNKIFYQMPSGIRGSNEIILALEQNGVSIK